MIAVVCTKGGPPEVLQLKEIETPTPSDRQVTIKIFATTVTAGDVILRSLTGLPRLVFGLAFGLGKDKILGHELAGEVVAVGGKVKHFSLGDQVFASTGNQGGAYAEYICLPEDAILVKKPANMSFEEAAAVPVGGITALLLLRKVDIKSGMNVLVYGASGSVGSYAVQLARILGAEVTGVCSTTNMDMVTDLGAKKVIDYTQDDFTRSGETYDVIFDAVNKISSSDISRSLKKHGTFLSVKSSIRETTDDLEFLKGLIEAGKIKAVIDRRYPLDQIVEAHRYVEKGHKKGNVVIIVNPTHNT